MNRESKQKQKEEARWQALIKKLKDENEAKNAEEKKPTNNKSDPNKDKTSSR